MKKKSFIVAVTICLSFSVAQLTHAQGIKDKLGLGFNLGAQKPYCDYHHSDFAPGVEALIRLVLSQRFNLSLNIGYAELTAADDGIGYPAFRTNLINTDLKGNLYLKNQGRFRPYFMLGLGLHNFQYENSDRYFDGSFIYGGGFEYFLQNSTALEAYADYRHTTGDALDGIVRQEMDGYLQIRLGLTYYFKDRLAPEDKTLEEELIAMDEQDLADLFAEDQAVDTTQFKAFEQKLNEMETADSEFAMDEYLRYKSKIDELNLIIAQKEKEIEDLRVDLDFKRDRISELEDELQRRSVPTYAIPTTTASSAGFSVNYEEGLRNFYSRQYDAAIETFQVLLVENPSHKLTSNCQYWIGESYFGKGDYYRASEAFNRVFDYDFSYKKDDATLMLGRCYQKLGDYDRARVMLETLLRDYPDSEYRGKAQQHLNRLRG